jgi:energy-coupling factor transport system ATP-binding protein
MAETALAFIDFSFTYKAQTAPSLSNINVTIRQGEKVLVLGASGSGKSTFIHCVNGLIPHAFKGKISGSLSLLGENAENLTVFSIAKKAGTVLQDTDGQFVGMSAAEDIAFAAENDCMPVSEMRDQVFASAKLVNIEKHLLKTPHNLSGGQKQRVAIAGVLMDKVEILLFDEPLANLDPASGKQIIELIDELHKKTKKTIIIIEHRLEDVLYRPVDRIVVIEKGRVIADMKPAALLASDILRKAGIREPLYLSALRYAGVAVTEKDKPENVHSVEFHADSLRNWHENLPDKTEKKERPTLLEVKDLNFRYNDGDLVLDTVSFSLEKGSITALSGKNGAGKSTLARLICGFDQPESGFIRFNGEDLTVFSIKERSERIGYVTQNPNQMISFPMIFDEAAFGLRNRGISENEVKERVDKTLAVCGLYPFRNWPIGALSYGQKKRLTIAAILVLGPELLILDEPTAGQDFRNYSRIMNFLADLNKTMGLTLLLITHDMHLMLEYAEKAIVLSEGKLVADAEPAAVLSDDRVIERASLKRTSLYDLAVRAGLPCPEIFIRKFIAYEREKAVYE